MSDEFYIGWEDKAAPGIAKRVWKAVIGLTIITIAAAVLLSAGQRMIGASVFEWGVQKSFAGTLRLEPYPHLLVLRPGATSGQPAFSTYHLVAPWKFGLKREAMASLDGTSVNLRGTLIYRGNQTMIETRPDWIQPSTESPVVAPANLALGQMTLTGEIVDSKCWLGVMNPGASTPHKACAIRCISGGIPPVLLVRRENAAPLYFMLISKNGAPVNADVLPLVAEPVSITGDVEKQGDLLVLRADPSTYLRLK